MIQPGVNGGACGECVVRQRHARDDVGVRIVKAGLGRPQDSASLRRSARLGGDRDFDDAIVGIFGLRRTRAR